MTRKSLNGKSESLLDIDRNSLISRTERECFEDFEMEQSGFRTILLLRYPAGRSRDRF